MKTLIKLGLVITLSVGLLFAAIVLWFLFLFDVNDHRDTIIAQVERTTGRTLELGAIALEFYPWLGIEVNDVLLSHTQAFNRNPFFQADKIVLRIKTLPLFSKRFELDTLRLHGAAINIAVSEKGLSNGSKPTQWQDPQKISDPINIAAFMLGGVDIRDLHLHWTNQATDQAFEINNLNASIGELTFGEPIDIQLQFKAISSKPDIQADLQMRGKALYDLDAQTYAFDPLVIMATLTGPNIPRGKTEVKLNLGLLFDANNNRVSFNELELDGLGTLIRAQLQAENIGSDQQKVAAQISVSGDNLAILLRLIKGEQFVSQLAKLKDRRFDLQTRLNMDKGQGHFAISELQANLLGAIINGHLAADNMGTESMILAGELQASGPDLPILLQTATQLPIEALAPLQIYGKKLATVNNQGFDMDIKFDVDLTTGNIQVPSLSLNALGLSIKGDLRVEDISGQQRKVNGVLSIKGEKLSSLLLALEQEPLANIVDTLSADIGISSNRDSIMIKPLQAQVTLASSRKAPTKLTLNAATQINLAEQTLSVSDIHLAGSGLNIKANIKAKAISDNPTYSGELDIAEFNLRQLMQSTDLKIPQTTDKEVLKKVSLRTKFFGSSDSFTLNTLSVLLDDSKLSGDFSVKNFAQPIFNATMAIDSIDVDRYLPVAAGEKDTAVETPPEPSPLSFATFKHLKVKSALQVGQLVIAKLRLNNINLGIDINDRLMRLDPMAADIYQGHYQGSITLDTREDLARFRTDMQLSGLQIAELIKDQTQSTTSKLSGITDISVKISSIGSNVRQFKDNLSGQVKLVINEGIFELINIGKIVRKATSLLKNKGTDTRKFGQLTATLFIDGGSIKNNDLLITSPAFQINGGINGKYMLADLHDQSIDYDLAIKLSKANGLTIPIECRGVWQDDLSTICRSDYKAVVGSLIKGKLGKKLGNIRDLLPEKKQATEPEEAEQQRQGKDPLDQLKDQAIEKIFDKLF